MPVIERALPRATRLLLIVLAVFALVLPSIEIVLAQPHAGDYFEYEYDTHVDKGTGYYNGYSDVMRSHSHYSITAVSGDTSTVSAIGSWNYRASDGTRTSGTLDMIFNFSTTSRRYLDKVDVEGSFSNPTVWFWISPGVKTGDVIPILDDTFTVTSTDKTVWLGLVPHKAIALTASGEFARNDSYGRFAATYVDTYYFDRETGFLVAEFYAEHDSDAAATFRYTSNIEVTASSYSIPTDWQLFYAIYVGVPGVIVVVTLSVWLYRRGPSQIKIEPLSGSKTVKIRRVRKKSQLEALTLGGSRFFTPFLRVFGERALALNDPVTVAVCDQELLGMVVRDRESKLGSLFTLDEKIAKGLTRRVRMRDFFVEADESKWDLSPARRADSFEILELKNPKPTAYDVTRVRAMTAADIPRVKLIAEEVYLRRARKWVKSCFDGGDIAYVAQQGGQLVGFGFATVVDTYAYLHSLTVLPSHQSMGFGTDIMAARLSVLAALGVESVVSEISMHNIPSMKIATEMGFTRIGSSTYYTSRRKGAEEMVYERRY